MEARSSAFSGVLQGEQICIKRFGNAGDPLAPGSQSDKQLVLRKRNAAKAQIRTWQGITGLCQLHHR
jgi:Fe2+ transport system protein FeoA